VPSHRHAHCSERRPVADRCRHVARPGGHLTQIAATSPQRSWRRRRVCAGLDGADVAIPRAHRDELAIHRQQIPRALRKARAGRAVALQRLVEHVVARSVVRAGGSHGPRGRLATRGRWTPRGARASRRRQAGNSAVAVVVRRSAPLVERTDVSAPRQAGLTCELQALKGHVPPAAVPGYDRRWPRSPVSCAPTSCARFEPSR
jgi:hypothetical protein